MMHETCDRRGETGDMIQKARHDIRDFMQETGDVRQKKRKVRPKS